MPNIIPLNNSSSHCAECLQAKDCLIASETRGVSNVASSARVRVLHANDYLYRTGETMESMYRVRTGSIKTVISRSDGSEQVTGFYGPEEWLGMDAVESGSHFSDAVALDTASVCAIPVRLILEHCGKSGKALTALMSIFSGRVNANERLHMSLACDNASQRLANFLLALSNRRAVVNLDSDFLYLSMARQEIASYLALAVETVSRLLTQMQKRELIRVTRSRIEILDRKRLIEYAGGNIGLQKKAGSAN